MTHCSCCFAELQDDGTVVCPTCGLNQTVEDWELGYRAGLIRHEEETVDFFSNKPGKKQAREIAICTAFLKCIRLKFNSQELMSPAEDPPDVVFRDARFEIMLKLDPDRRMDREHKDRRDRYKTAPQGLDNLMEPSPTVPALPYNEMLTDLVGELGNKEAKYKKRHIELGELDALVYANYQKKANDTSGLQPFRDSLSTPADIASQFSDQGWRSVSVVFDWNAVVVYASSRSPAFIRARVGQFCQHVDCWGQLDGLWDPDAVFCPRGDEW